METSTKFLLGGIAITLFAEGWRSASLDFLPREPDPIKRLDIKQKAQGLEILSLVGSGLFWTGAYQKHPKTVVGLGVAATALAYAPRAIKWFDPKGWEAAQASVRSHHRVPAPMTPVVTSGEFAGAPRHLYRARHSFEPQDQQDQQQYHHSHHQQHHHR